MHPQRVTLGSDNPEDRVEEAIQKSVALADTSSHILQTYEEADTTSPSGLSGRWEHLHDGGADAPVPLLFYR